MIDPVKQKEAEQQAIQYLNDLNVNFVPKLKIIFPTEKENPSVEFNCISYGDLHTQTLVFENEGDGLLEFEIARVNESSKLVGGKNKNLINNSCLTIEPLRGVIKAGEKMNINVKLEIS
jgi:hypothetical protein